MSEKFSLKDHLFNKEKVSLVSNQIRNVYDTFDSEGFITDVLSEFPKLELKARITHIAKMFEKYLPLDFIEACDILLASLPAPLDPSKRDDDFGDFIYSPYSHFVALRGCCDEHLEYSLKALKEMTKRFSVEFDIRTFINNFPTRTLEMLKECSVSTNYHLRRLASEGLRPTLPWAKNINIDYHKPLDILDNLFCDSTRYATRSVANHMNDISKKDPSLVIQTLNKWQKSGEQNEDEMTYIINHSLRTLVKLGNKEALEFLGFSATPDIKISNFEISSDEVEVGEALEFSFDILALQDERLIVDYIIYFQTKAHKLSPKVHKITKLDLVKDEYEQISKKHIFRANMTTRKLYDGLHKVAIQINGKIYFTKIFNIKGTLND